MTSSSATSGAFQANVVIHNTDEGVAAARLPKMYSVSSFNKLRSWYIHIVQTVEPMNAMPRNGVVFSYSPRREKRATTVVLVVDVYLYLCKVGRCQCNPQRICLFPQHIYCFECNFPCCCDIFVVDTPVELILSIINNHIDEKKKITINI